MVEIPSYPELQRVLTQARAVSDAPEAHGTLVGALCAAARYSLEDWIAEILPEGRASEAAAAPLRAMFEATVDALRSDEMQFQPLLPADEDSLAERAGALGEWCQGFLYGLGTGQFRDVDAAGSEVGEILRDLTEITRLDIDPEDGEAANEEAYAELVEFVRVGVQLVFEQLEPLRDVPRPSGVPLH